MIQSTLIELLDESINEDSNSITFILGAQDEKEVSYYELYGKSKKVLWNLQQAGLKKGDEVIISLSSNEELIYTFVACLLGGYIAIPLDDTATEANLDRLLKIKKQMINWTMITEKSVFDDFMNIARKDEDRKELDEMRSKTIYFNDLDFQVPYGTTEAITKDDIVMIQYSSGSTGNPKGVILTHENMISNIEAIMKCYNQTSEDVYFSWLPLHHDLGLIWFCILPIFLNLKQYNMHPSLFLREPLLWMEIASKKKADVLVSPNFGYKHLVRNIDENADYGWDLGHIRCIANGAEPISYSAINEFNEKLKKYNLNSNTMCPGYGLAESTLVVSFTAPGTGAVSIKLNRDYLSVGDKIVRAKTGDNYIELVLLGEILDNVEVRITDYDGNVLPDEYVGQVEIKGKSVTKGYYKENPEDRKKYMTEDGWLNTGDIGFMVDRNLVIAARQKDVFILGGKNLYLTDIEQVLERIEEVPQGNIITCVETAKDNEDMLIVCVKGEKIDEQFGIMYRKILKALSRGFGIKTIKIIPIDEIPKTGSGKKQRFKALQIYKSINKNEIERMEKLLASVLEKTDDQENVESEDDMELSQIREKLKQIVCSQIGEMQISDNESFFELGGDSITFKCIVQRIVEVFNKSILPSSIYIYPRINELAKHIRDVANIKESDSARIEKLKSKENFCYELSEQQRRMYLLSCMDQKSLNYNISVVWEITGKLDVKQAETAFAKLVERHDCLRTSFYMENGNIMQKVHENVAIDFTTKALDESDDLNEVVANAIQPFDLSVAPLVRVKVIEQKEEKYYLVFDMHHIIGDGISIRILTDEWTKLYEGKSLPAIKAEYFDYVQYQKNYLGSSAHKNDKEFWNNMYDNKPFERIFLTDNKRVDMLRQNGKKLFPDIPADIVKELKAYGRKKNRTLFMLLLASFSIVLSDYYEEDDIAIGIPYMGRPESRFDEVVGIFVNTVAIRLHIQNDATFEEYLSYIRDVCMDYINHSEYQFNDLVEDLHCKRENNRNPIFDVFLALQNIQPDKLAFKDTVIRRLDYDNDFARFDLAIDIFDEASCHCVVEYRESLWKADTIRELFERNTYVLSQILQNPNIAVSELRKGRKREKSSKKSLGMKLK